MAWILAAALLVRLTFLYHSHFLPFFDHPIIDPREYDSLARVLFTSGEAWRSASFYQAPGYAYFLAVMYKIFDGSRAAAHVAGALVGTAAVYLTYRLGRDFFGRTTGVIAAGILAFYGPMILYEGDFYREPLLAVLCLLFLGSLHRALRSQGLVWWFLAGLSLACAVSVRENMLAYAPFALYLCFAGKSPPLDRSRKAAALLLPLAVFIFWISYKNHEATGKWTYVSSQGGLGFYMGNHPETDRLTTLQPGIEYDKLMRLPLIQAGITDSREAAKWYYGEAFRFIRDHPASWLKIILKKLLIFWNGYEWMPNENLELYRSHSWVLRALLFRLGPFSFPFGLIGPLAVFGFFAALKAQRKEALWLGGAILIYLLTFLPFHMRARFRIPMIPFFAILAAYGLKNLLDLALSRNWNQFMKSAGACAALILALNAPLLSTAHAEKVPTHYYLAKAYQDLKDYEKAHAYYEKAIADGFSLPEVYNDLGMLYNEQGDPVRALACLEKSVALYPEYEKMRINLGLAYADMGRPDLAVGQFKEAARINPYSILPRLNYARLLEKTDRKEAERQYLKIFELYEVFPMTDAGMVAQAKEGLWRLGRLDVKGPDLTRGKLSKAALATQKEMSGEIIKAADLGTPEGRVRASNAYNDLGLAYMRAGEAGQAEQMYLKSLEISYAQSPAHTNLGVLYKKQGRPDLALKHYGEALKTTPDSPIVLNNLGRIYEEMKDYAKALEYYKKALAVEPGNMVIRRNLAKLEAVMKK